jgi:serine/threonine protein kinase
MMKKKRLKSVANLTAASQGGATAEDSSVKSSSRSKTVPHFILSNNCLISYAMGLCISQSRSSLIVPIGGEEYHGNPNESSASASAKLSLLPPRLTLYDKESRDVITPLPLVKTEDPHSIAATTVFTLPHTTELTSNRTQITNQSSPTPNNTTPDLSANLGSKYLVAAKSSVNTPISSDLNITPITDSNHRKSNSMRFTFNHNSNLTFKSNQFRNSFHTANNLTPSVHRNNTLINSQQSTFQNFTPALSPYNANLTNPQILSYDSHSPHPLHSNRGSSRRLAIPQQSYSPALSPMNDPNNAAAVLSVDIPSPSGAYNSSNTYSPSTRTAIETNFITTSYTKNGQKQINQYIILSDIARGSYGAVKLVYNCVDHQQYAMKVVSKSLMQRRKVVNRRNSLTDSPSNNNPNHFLQKEIAIMKKLDHRNIVPLIEVLDDESTDNLYIIMQLMKQASVKEKEKTSKSHNSTSTNTASTAALTDAIPPPYSDKSFIPLELSTAHKYFVDALCGLEYLHVNYILHRDLKPENLLLGAAEDSKSDEFVLKISDFGASAYFSGGVNDIQYGSVGSAAFMAPEICSNSSAGYSGQKADIWALGCCLYVFITGRLPFHSASVHQTYETIVKQPLTFPDDITLPVELKDLLSNILNKDPAARYCVEAIKQHPWIRGGLESIPSQFSVLPVLHRSTTLTVSQAELKNSLSSVNRMYVWLKSRGKLNKRPLTQAERTNPLL